jgi:hypothetical protein
MQTLKRLPVLLYPITLKTDNFITLGINDFRANSYTIKLHEFKALKNSVIEKDVNDLYANSFLLEFACKIYL